VLSVRDTRVRREVLCDDGVAARVTRDGRILPIDAFYNDAINAERHNRIDYEMWVKGRFSFCRHPFVLDPASKARVLMEDARHQMARHVNNAFMRARLGMRETQYLVVRVDRQNLIETTLQELREGRADLKKPLRVKFKGEEGVDEGGVQKEFFQLITRALFVDPELSEHTFDMWEYDTDTRLFWFNKDSYTSNVEFELLGTILGLAIYNSVILDIRFPRVVYQKLCGVKPSFEDFREAFPALARSFERLLDFDGDVEATFGSTFSLEYESFGAVRTVELKPGGKDVPLTADNRVEYVDLYMDYVLNRSVETKFRAFQAGFDHVVGDSALGDAADRGGIGSVFEMLRPEELELLVVGSPDLDFAALEANCHYDSGFDAGSATVRHFWEVVHAMTVEEQKRLLAFSTGSDRVPLGGLGSMRFTISRHGPNSDRLPTAHTCFNHLLLPDYEDKEKLERLLKIAIRNSEGFGML
jgi:hypothetical protein